MKQEPKENQIDNAFSALEEANKYQQKFEQDVVNNRLIQSNPELKQLAEKIQEKLSELNNKVNQQVK